ncbi:CDP-alcohol phosphatidyltransferase family protein [Streptomyces sp. CO7]
MSQLSLKAVQHLTCKKRDAWWTVFLVDPLATRLLLVMAKFRFITPNGVTWAALVLGLASAGLFLTADPVLLVVGAVVYHFSFVLDCVDGKLARLKNNGSLFGGWLDYVFDRIRVLACAFGLMGGQYLRTGEGMYLAAGLLVVFLDSLRYLDALQIYKMRAGMRGKIRKTLKARRAAEARAAAAASALAEAELGEDVADTLAAAAAVGPGAASGENVVFMEDLLREGEAEGENESEARAAELRAGVLTANSRQVIDLHTGFHAKFPWYTRVRRALVDRRVRPHLVSGIEFQMFVFIVGPLIGQLLWTTAVAAALMLSFELLIMYKFWLSTKDFNRVMAELAPGADSNAGVIVPEAYKNYVPPVPVLADGAGSTGSAGQPVVPLQQDRSQKSPTSAS